MNDFTKDELEELMHCVYVYRDLWDEDVEDNLCDKLKYMIDNYQEHPWNVRIIAKSHLSEAASLIYHAMCLLGLDDE